MNLSEEYLDQRDAELDRIIAEARAEKEMLAGARRYVAFAKARVGGSIAETARPAVSTPPIASTLFPIDSDVQQSAVRQLRNGKPTLSALIVDVLRDSPDRVWLTANEIQERVADRLGDTPPMSSISPKLSDLKNRKVIVRHEMRVALTARANGEVPM